MGESDGHDEADEAHEADEADEPNDGSLQQNDECRQQVEGWNAKDHAWGAGEEVINLRTAWSPILDG
jgi:hypothetical protein